MNAYAVNTPNEVVLYHQTEIDPEETGFVYEVVIAKSPSEARKIVTNAYRLDCLTPLSIRKLWPDVDMPGGFVCQWQGEDAIGLLVQAAVVWYDMTEAEEYYQWFGYYDESVVMNATATAPGPVGTETGPLTMMHPSQQARREGE